MKNRTIGIILLIVVIGYIFKDEIKNLFRKNNNDTTGTNKPVDKTLPFKDIGNITLIQGTAGCYDCNTWGDCKKSGFFIEISPINEKLKLKNLIGNINIDKYTQSVNSMIYYTKDVNLVLKSISKFKEIGGVVRNSPGKFNYYNC